MHYRLTVNSNCSPLLNFYFLKLFLIAMHKKLFSRTKNFVNEPKIKKKIGRIFSEISAFAPDPVFFDDFFRTTHPGGWQNVAPPRAGGCGISALNVRGQNPALRARRKFRPYRFSVFGSWRVVNLTTIGLPGKIPAASTAQHPGSIDRTASTAQHRPHSIPAASTAQHPGSINRTASTEPVQPHSIDSTASTAQHQPNRFNRTASTAQHRPHSKNAKTRVLRMQKPGL